MALSIQQVQSGDVITANLMNQIIQALSGLDGRLSKLEAGATSTGGVTISAFNPPGVRVGDILEIDGSGFLVPPQLNQVTIAGVPAPNFQMSSSTTKLLVAVPNITGLDPQGTQVTVAVSNSNGSAQAQLTLKPQLVVPQGNVAVQYINPPVVSGDGTIKAGTYTFGFSVTAFADRDGTYTITPAITGNGGWAVSLLQGNQLSLAGNVTGTQQAVSVAVTVPGGQPTGTVGTLQITVTENTPGTKVVPGSAQIQITTGSPPPTPDNRVVITFQSPIPQAQLVGTNLQFTSNAVGGAKFNISLTQGGTYSVTAAMSNSAGWTSQGIDVPGFTVAQPAGGATANQPINVLFTPGGGAAATNLLLTVTRGSDLSVTYVQAVTVA
jgi:hypothetical protein